MAKNQKAWYMSKTLWINALAIGGAWLSQLANLLSAEQNITLLAAINLLLRLVTKEKLSLK